MNEEVGIDRNGREAHYLVHLAPVLDDEGRVVYVIEMSVDITETKRLKREYRVLFEGVPCYVAVLNKDYRVVRANRRIRETFGKTTGQYCHQVFKDRSSRCRDCPVEKTFRDGGVHTAR